MWLDYPGDEFVAVAFNIIIIEKQNSPSCFHILHKSLRLFIVCCCFKESEREMYQNVYHKCRATVFSFEPIIIIAMFVLLLL